MDTFNIQDRKDVTETPLNQGVSNLQYTRRLTRHVQGVKALWSIIQKVSLLDYPIIYHSGNEGKIFTIGKLRGELKDEQSKPYKERDYDKITNIKDRLYDFEPENKVKYVICSNYLQAISEELKLGVGFNNTFPYFYNSCYWEEIRPELMKEFLIIGAEKTGFNPYQIQIIDRIEALFKQFAYSSIIPTPKDNNDSIKINLQNGTFTIERERERQSLAPFDSEDMFKYQLQFNYNPEEKAPMFMQFLDEVLPEKESQMILAEYIGYVLTRNLKLEKCLVLVGSGANGKSVVFDIVNALLGKENVSSYTLSQLCYETGYFRVNLTNRLLNYSSELGGKGCSPDTVKQLISNEPIVARSPYKEAVELRDYAKMMFNVNLFPKDGEQTMAYFRRFIFLAFDVTIPEENQDKNLAKKIINKELSGIFNWVLEGLSRILENEQFTKSPKSEAKMNEIKLETNTVLEFMNELGYKPDKTKCHHIEKKELFSKYVDFCKECQYHSVGYKEFTRRLKEIGYAVEGKKTNNQTWVFCVSDQNERQKQIQKETSVS